MSMKYIQIFWPCLCIDVEMVEATDGLNVTIKGMDEIGRKGIRGTKLVPILHICTKHIGNQ